MDGTSKSVVYLDTDEDRSVKPLGAVNRYTLLIPLCILGILVANAYSLMITNNGLLVSNIFPDLRVIDLKIPQSYATFLFAGVLQFGIMVLYLLLAVTRPLQKIVILPFLAVLVSVSFYFGFISVHSNARGDAYVGSLTKRIDNLTAAVTGENRFIAQSVNESLQGNLRLAEASKRGEDKTGIAACGALCQGYYDRAEAIRGQYGHLMVVPGSPPATTDVPEQWREAGALYAAYLGRARDYDRLLRDQHPASGYAVSPALQESHDSLQQIFGKGLDDRWMLTAHSLGDIGRDISVGVSALISIMPDVINLALAMTISALMVLSRRGKVSRRPRRDYRVKPTIERQDPVIGTLPAISGEQATVSESFATTAQAEPEDLAFRDTQRAYPRAEPSRTG